MIEPDGIPFLEHDTAKRVEILPSQRTGGLKKNPSFRAKGFCEDRKDSLLKEFRFHGPDVFGGLLQRGPFLVRSGFRGEKAYDYWDTEKQESFHSCFFHPKTSKSCLHLLRSLARLYRRHH